MVELIEIMVPLAHIVSSPQSIALLGVLETLDDYTTFILVDQHIVDGVSINECREEYRAHVKKLHEDRELARKACLYFDG